MKLTPEEQKVQAAIRALGPVRAEPTFRHRLKRDFVRGEFEDRTARAGAREKSRWWIAGWTLVPAAAVVVLALFILVQGPAWKFIEVAGEGQVVVDGRSVPAGESAQLARLIDSGSRVKIEKGMRLGLLLEDILVAELDLGADTTLPDPASFSPGEKIIWPLHFGELRIRTGPGFTGRGLRVETPEGLIEVTGTVISVDKDNGYTCVCVHEGVARVGKSEEILEEIPAGMRKVMFSGDREDWVTEIEPHHEEGLVEFTERYREVFR